MNDGHISIFRVTETNLILTHNSRPFTLSCMQIIPLDGFDYHIYPLVAMCGIVSKVIIFDVKQMVQVKSLRVLVSNS